MTPSLFSQLSIQEKHNLLGKLILAAQDDAYFLECNDIVAHASRAGFYDTTKLIDARDESILDLDTPIENGVK